MSVERYTCCDDRRLRAVKEAGVLNGIEYVEVYDSEAPPGLRQLALLVRLLQPAPGLTPEMVAGFGVRVGVGVILFGQFVE